MDIPMRSANSNFIHDLLQYEIPHTAMIPNMPKYDGTTGPNDHIENYEWTTTSLKMDCRFTCTYFPCTLTENAGKWFKSLRPGNISSFEQLKYLFLNNFMQLRKGKGDANSVMMCKKKGELIRDYYDRFTLATLNVPGHEEFLVTGAFAQGLLPGPLSKKM
uniref:Retrotransposon gag domain-containing protein n=1 Tax=Lactuca sativa TaxID=4236 RepID=A0A9R1UUB4_LACSA|nr:hypothetical protein LSAT_V11C800394640 [Lactuca sativa]